jgi:hypothetical protein
LGDLIDVIADKLGHSNLTILDTHPMTTPLLAKWSLAWRHQTISNRIVFLERDLVQVEQPTFSQASSFYDSAKVLAET